MKTSSAALPPTGYLRLHDIIGRKADPKRDRPAIPALIPVSRTTWLKNVAAGKCPKPTRALGSRISAWRVEDIVRYIDEAAKGMEGQ